MTIDVDTSGFVAMINALAELSGKSFEHVLIDQVAALIRNCIAHTQAAKGGAIVKRVSRHNNYIEFEDGSVISTWKKAGGVQMFLDRSNYVPRKGQRQPLLIGGKSWHNMTENRWSNDRWGRYQSLLAAAQKRQQSVEKALGARGLAKRSWLDAALDLSLDPAKVGAPGYVQSASPSNGASYKNGAARSLLEGAAVFMEISNDQPILVNKLNGAEILQQAVDARIKAFGIETSTGVFDTIAARAKRYPGIFTT